MKLFCLPYAGGSATYYIKWKKYLNSAIELYPVELSGRGRRYSAPFYNSIADAVEDVYSIIKDMLDKEPYAIFAHSMGSVIAYELGVKIMNLHPEPVHVFVSGGTAPHARKKLKPTHNLPLEQFKEEILKYGGTPDHFFDNEELLKLFLPILRADIKLLEEYSYGEGRELVRFNSPISVFCGKTDVHAPIETINEWQKLTKKECRIYPFEGGHFFIHDNEKEIANIIDNSLLNFVKRV